MGCCQKKKQSSLLEGQSLLPRNNYQNAVRLDVSDNNSDNAGSKFGSSDNNDDHHLSNVKISYSDFEPIKLLGRGSFGEVLLVRLKANRKLYAMKVLNKFVLKIKKQEIHTKTERDLMVKINCPFIVNIKSAFQDEKRLYLVSEFMQGGDMFYHLHDVQQFDNERTKFYIMEIVLALEFLHKNNMIYRDLKPENILLDDKGHIKLTDFGLSKIMEEANDKAFTICGTPQYLAPEVLKKQGYTKSVDWWSLGCILYEMLTGRLPFPIKRGVRLNNKIYEQQIQFPVFINEAARDLIKNLLIVDPTQRLGNGENGSENVKNHKFFNGINWNDAWNRKIRPPFVPKLSNETDLRYFDVMFTSEPIDLNNTNRKNSVRSRESSMDYEGFSYVAGSVSNELMTFANGVNDANDE